MSEDNQNERDRYPLNAEGPFYVEKDLCLFCMMPEYEAPELMGFDSETNHCYFKKQPSNPEELDHAINAIASSDIAALRYAGNDPYILRRLVAAQSKACCDALTPKEEPRASEGQDGTNLKADNASETWVGCIKKMLKMK